MFVHSFLKMQWISCERKDKKKRKKKDKGGVRGKEQVAKQERQRRDIDISSNGQGFLIPKY